MTMEKKIKVLMVVFNLSVANGVSSYVMNYFRNLDHNKIIMDFVVYQDVETPYSKEIIDNGGHIFKVPSIKNLYSHMNTSKKIICQGQYDIVHDNILILSYFIMHYAKKYKVPVRILHSHSSRFSGSKYKALRNKIFMPFLLHTITDKFACSKAAARGMFHDSNCILVPNVVSSQNFSFDVSMREKIRQKMKVQNQFVIGSVGRMAIEKNPIFAIKTIIELAQVIPNLQYWWIGDGPLMDEVKTLIMDNQANQYIRLFGNRNDVADLYQAMDIFFLPSLFEGLPVTALEAQAAGLQCLVSDTVSNEFVYTDLVTFFSLNDDTKKVIDIIYSLLGKKYNRSMYTRYLQESRFSDINAGAKLFQIYHDIIKKGENYN